MATFINKKEEVIQLELTPTGKTLYAQGKLTPAFYAFYDDDILYDPEYFASGSDFIPAEDRQPIASETQNQIVTRIKETPRLGIQAAYQKALSNRTSIGAISIDGDPFDRETEANDKFMKPLGQSSPFSEYAPAWDIRIMPDSVSFSGSLTGSRINPYTDTNLAIPKLSCSIDINYVKSQVAGVQNNEETVLPYWVLVEDNKILLDIQEVNTIFKSNGNFDVEVFKVNPRSNYQKEHNSPASLTKLGFINNSSLSQQGDILQRGSYESEVDSEYPNLDDSCVEYYLSIRVDKEISDLSPGLKQGPSSGLYSNTPSSPQDPCD